MSHTIRSSAVEALGTDVLVSVKGAEVDPAVQLGSTTGVEYFRRACPGGRLRPHSPREPDRRRCAGDRRVLAVQNLTTRQNEPRITLFASDQSHLAAFGDIRRRGDGGVQYLNDLRAGEVYLNADAADELKARAGTACALRRGESFGAHVKAIVDYKVTGPTARH